MSIVTHSADPPESLLINGVRYVNSIDKLESLFAVRRKLTFLIEPELAVHTITMLAGNSEAGKTTLACKWAIDLLGRGHYVLLLDRDGNPRERIQERFARLGLNEDHPRLRVWDCEQVQEPPLPDNPLISEWVGQRFEETGLSPVVIVDSLVTNLGKDESENSSTDIRKAINRCKTLFRSGATVVLIHHLGHNQRVRGSSDILPAVDQAFVVSNRHPDGLHLLSEITLTPEKTRMALSADITYRYNDGAMDKDDSWRQTNASAASDQVMRELLTANPGVTSSKFEGLCKGIAKQKVRGWLDSMTKAGKIKVTRGERNAQHHTWIGTRPAQSPDTMAEPKFMRCMSILGIDLEAA